MKYQGNMNFKKGKKIKFKNDHGIFITDDMSPDKQISKIGGET